MKSHVSILTALAERVIYDAAAKCAVGNHLRDLETLRSRVKHEGLSFLTLTLPQLGKDFERSLELGFIAPDLFRNFRKRLKAPAFLQGFFELVFDKTSGRIVDAPRIEAIESIRQIAYTFKKTEIPCTAERQRRAISEFQQCELVFEKTLDQADVTHFNNVSSAIWPYILGEGLFSSPLDVVPKHGPGATAEKASGNQKYLVKRWHERLESFFPMLRFAFHSENAIEAKEFQECSLISEDEEQPVRVCLVPKTLKTPRIIAIEPVCMQYTQQAIAAELISSLESNPLTSGHINFTDQSINRRMALSESRHRRYATLDMSSASDRVPNSLAMLMFESNPDLRDAIQACRSKNALLPDGEILPLRKFASMGSALCFPIEAMYFFTLVVMALIDFYRLPVGPQSVKKVARKVYVYGDDIIVPTDTTERVIETLQRYYCKVNAAKSFWTGKFRESCGMDAYDGWEVTPTYLKQSVPDNRGDASKIISWLKASNSFYLRGYWKSAEFLLNHIEAIVGALPIMGPRAAGLGKVSFQHLVSIERWNKKHQVPEVRAWCAVPVYSVDKLDGYPALLKCLLNLERQKPLVGWFKPDPQDKEHLKRSVRHGAVALKRRWIRPY